MDINRRRGQVNDMGDRAGAKTIKADVPLSENVLVMLRQGRFHLVEQHLLWNFMTCVPSISEAVIKKSKKETSLRK
jgi:elongation factor G